MCWHNTLLAMLDIWKTINSRQKGAFCLKTNIPFLTGFELLFLEIKKQRYKPIHKEDTSSQQKTAPPSQLQANHSKKHTREEIYSPMYNLRTWINFFFLEPIVPSIVDFIDWLSPYWEGCASFVALLFFSSFSEVPCSIHLIFPQYMFRVFFLFFFFFWKSVDA